jgi:3-oxoacyl-[acyl-carrier-protein] synthase II
MKENKQVLRRRVVVTGIGVVSPIGIGLSNFWESLSSGKSGCSEITRFDCTGNRVKIACEVKNFDPSDFIESKTAKRTSRFIQFALACAKMAHEDSGLDVFDKNDIGVYIGTGAGGFDALDDSYLKFHEKGARFTSPFAITSIIPNMVASNVAILLNLHGPCVTPVAACASGLYAIYDAYNAISYGQIKGAFAGGSESTMTSFVFSGYEALRVLSLRNDMPQSASRPFDKDRDGFVMGEGAAILFLEDLDSAVQREATIYCEIVGCSISCDAHHITSPDLTGRIISETMLNAIGQGNININEIAFISAHGTSTVLNDAVEAKAICDICSANESPTPAVTAIKSMIGHTLGASGAVALAASIKSLNEKVVPQTINTVELDDAYRRMNLVTKNVAIPENKKYALTNAFGFGGHNACIAVRHFCKE